MRGGGGNLQYVESRTLFSCYITLTLCNRLAVYVQRLAFVSNLGLSRIDSCRNGGMNMYCKETSDLENPWTREVMEPSNGWGPATQLLDEAIQIANGGTLPKVLFMLSLVSVY